MGDYQFQNGGFKEVNTMSSVESWKFEGNRPEKDDVEACCIATDKFFSIPEVEGMNDGERDVHLFVCGFYRGLNWAEHKLKDRELFRTLIIAQFVEQANLKIRCLLIHEVDKCEDCGDCDYRECELYLGFLKSWNDLQKLVRGGE
jgi:hypothetical protein